MLRFAVFLAAFALMAEPQSEVEDARQTWRALVEANAGAPGFKAFRNPDNMPDQVQKKAPSASQSKAPVLDKAMVGFTIWKLRPSQPSDPQLPRQKRFAHTPGAQPQTASVEMTPARIDLNARLQPQDEVILGISSTRTGYVYILSRELYRDGTTGEAAVVFPTPRLRGGKNYVQAGQTIRIPDKTDDPPVLRFEPSPSQISEEVIVLVVPRRLTEIEEHKKISAAKLEAWKKEWLSVIRHVDAGERNPMSDLEVAAFARPGQEMIIPQRFYLMQANPGANLMAAVPLVVGPRGK